MDRLINIKISGSHLSKDSKLAGVRGEANVNVLRIAFDEGWDAYTKRVTFWDAKGQNPVERILTADLLEDLARDTLTYLCPIPGEPMAEAGMMSFVIDGYADGKRPRSMGAELEVEYAPIADTAGHPAEPTPSQAEQLQRQIDVIKQDVQKAAQGAQHAERAEQYAADAKASADAAAAREDSAVQNAIDAASSAERAERALSLMGTNAEDAARSAAEAKAAQAKAEDAEAKAAQSAQTAANAAAGIQDKVDAAAQSAEAAAQSAQGVSTYAAEAQASAAAAKTSENNAASSASKAKTSETNAASSASTASTAKSDAEKAATRAETAQAAAESANATAQTAKTAAESAKAAAESARAGAVAAKEGLETAASNANASASAAANSASNAAASEAAAEAAQAAAEKARDEAQQAAGGDFATPGYVSGQIGAHNAATDAHADIRQAVLNAQSDANDAWNMADAKPDIFLCYYDETYFDDVNEAYMSGDIVLLQNGYDLWSLAYAEEDVQYKFSTVSDGKLLTATVDADGLWSTSEEALGLAEHASTDTTYGKGSSNYYGHVKLSDATDSSSNSASGVAATPNAVKAAYDKAVSAAAAASGAASAANNASNLVSSKADKIHYHTASEVGAAPATHRHYAEYIDSGTFGGQVVAKSSEQATDTYLLRNTRLAASDTNPTVNGEICWTYK